MSSVTLFNWKLLSVHRTTTWFALVCDNVDHFSGVLCECVFVNLWKPDQVNIVQRREYISLPHNKYPWQINWSHDAPLGISWNSFSHHRDRFCENYSFQHLCYLLNPRWQIDQLWNMTSKFISFSKIPLKEYWIFEFWGKSHLENDAKYVQYYLNSGATLLKIIAKQGVSALKDI